MKINSYRDLIVWQKGISLAEGVYKLTGVMPDRERYGLVSQMQRCAVSVSSNIAEGFGRGSTKELVQFLFVSRGSVMELETQLTIAVRVGLIDRETAVPIYQEAEQIARMLSKMIAKLKKRIRSKPTNH